MINLKNVSKTYELDGETFTALKNINLTIKKGDFTALLGPSGCGKSTLMHIIGLLDNPSSGTIHFNEKDVSKLSDQNLSQFRNEYVGFVFQQFNLINKLSVLENVLLPTVYDRRKKISSPKTRAFELLKRFGIESKATSYPHKLSGGQQQRVAIARALINLPRLILADEPTGNLDSKTGSSILSLIKELNSKDGITVLIVTHDDSIASSARQKLSMFDGQLV